MQQWHQNAPQTSPTQHATHCEMWHKFTEICKRVSERATKSISNPSKCIANLKTPVFAVFLCVRDMQPAITSIVEGVSKVVPMVVKKWYFNKLTERLAKTGTRLVGHKSRR